MKNWSNAIIQLSFVLKCLKRCRSCDWENYIDKMLVEYKIICTVLPYSGLVKYKGGSKRFETDIQFLIWCLQHIWNNYEHILLTKIKLQPVKIIQAMQEIFFSLYQNRKQRKNLKAPAPGKLWPYVKDILGEAYSVMQLLIYFIYNLWLPGFTWNFTSVFLRE